MKLARYAKLWVAIAGGVCTAAISLFGADSTFGKVATLIVAGCTAYGVYKAENAPLSESPPAGLRDTGDSLKEEHT